MYEKYQLSGQRGANWSVHTQREHEELHWISTNKQKKNTHSDEIQIK